MKHYFLLLACAAAAFLSSCATGAKPENMAFVSYQTNQFDSKLKNQIEIKEGQGGQETNPLLTSEISGKDFSDALAISLNRANLLTKDNGRYDLNSNVISVKQPFAGLDLTVRMNVHYTLKDNNSNRMLIDKYISSEYTAKFSDSYYAVERLKKANEGAARNNIKKFVDELAKLNL